MIKIKHKISGEVLKTVDAANLSGADLSGADLSGAGLHHANLRGANLPSLVTRINGLRWDVVIVCGWMIIGCQNHEISKWAEFTDEEIKAMDEGDALTFWSEHKDMLLKMAELNESFKK